MALGAGKSCCWATEARERNQLREHFQGHEIEVVLEERSLGSYLSYTRRKCKSRIDRTWPDTKAMLMRIEATRLPLEVRAILIGIFVQPKALYGCAVCPPQKNP